MYLVVLPTEGIGPHLFSWADPRRDGCPHPVIEDVDFIDLPPRDDHWKFGGSIPLDDIQEDVLARSRRQPKKFKAFKSGGASRTPIRIQGDSALDLTPKLYFGLLIAPPELRSINFRTEKRTNCTRNVTTKTMTGEKDKFPRGNRASVNQTNPATTIDALKAKSIRRPNEGRERESLVVSRVSTVVDSQIGIASTVGRPAFETAQSFHRQMTNDPIAKDSRLDPQRKKPIRMSCNGLTFRVVNPSSAATTPSAVATPGRRQTR